MRALLCDCGQHLKADDKEALLREVREHLKREDRPREHHFRGGTHGVAVRVPIVLIAAFNVY